MLIMRTCHLLLVTFALAIVAYANIINKADRLINRSIQEITTINPADERPQNHNAQNIIKIQKPRIVVTLLTNTKQLLPVNESDNRMDIFRPFDPLQRFLQFFFSNVMRDLAQPPEPFFDFDKGHVEKRAPTTAVVRNITSKNRTDTTATEPNVLKIEDIFPKRELMCGNNYEGLCRCNTQPESQDLIFGNADVKETMANAKNETTDQLASSSTGAVIMHNVGTKSLNKVTIKDEPKNNAKHYFLSISGVADDSVAAINNSDHKFRYRRAERYGADAELVDGNQFAAYVHGKDIGDSKHVQKVHDFKATPVFAAFAAKQEDQEEKTAKPKKKTEPETARKAAEEVTTDAATTIAETTEDGDILTEQPIKKAHGFDDLEDPIPPSPVKYTSGKQYLLTVTLPTCAAFAILITGLCCCMRAKGFCCSMFLADHSKVEQVEEALQQVNK